MAKHNIEVCWSTSILLRSLFLHCSNSGEQLEFEQINLLCVVASNAIFTLQWILLYPCAVLEIGMVVYT